MIDQHQHHRLDLVLVHHHHIPGYHIHLLILDHHLLLLRVVPLNLLVHQEVIVLLLTESHELIIIVITIKTVHHLCLVIHVLNMTNRQIHIVNNSVRNWSMILFDTETTISYLTNLLVDHDIVLLIDIKNMILLDNVYLKEEVLLPGDYPHYGK